MENKKESTLNEGLNNDLKEFSLNDQKIISKEIKCLRASINGLESRIKNLHLIDDASDEMKEFFKSRGGVPPHLDHFYGDQDKMDSLLDELNFKKNTLENIKNNILNKDMESIISNIKKRVSFDDKKYESYSISGEEYHKEEDRFNKKIKEDREKKDQEQINKLRNDIRNMPMN